jgi:hypothetical protein
MPGHQVNKIRALLLLMVFSLNTVTGFACSIGLNMGYNSKHHDHQAVKPHNDSKPHSHGALHKHKHKQSHGAASGARFNNVKYGDDCCANDVTSFIKLDKLVAANNLLLQTPIFLLAFTSSYFANIGSTETPLKRKFPHLRRWRPPNDTDIRIAIQSFQI